MTEMVGPLLEWLHANPQFAGLVTFLISALESVAIIGTIVPGSVTMTAIGTLTGAGVIPLWSTLFWATMGAIVGDGVSYWIGHYFKDRLRYTWPFRGYPGLLESGERFVHKYGVMSVFIGRFVGPVRAIVPVVAGMLGMKPLQFTVANVLSAIGWAPAYLLPGILLGAASAELPPDIAIHVILVLLLMGLFIILCLWIAYKLLKLFHTQTDQIQNWIWAYLKKKKSLRIFTHLLKHHDPTRTHGQLNLFFYFLAAGCLFLLLAYWVLKSGAPTIGINDSAYHFFRGIRTLRFDNIAIAITLLGQKEILLPVIAVAVVFLMIARRFRAAFHIFLLGILASGAVYTFKHLIRSVRPSGILLSPETFSMPSGHTTLATVFWIGFAYFASRKLGLGGKRFLYTCSIILVFLIGLSRLYLGAHWFTDVLAGWLLGAAVLMFTIISYERKAEWPFAIGKLVLISFVTLVITYSFYTTMMLQQLRTYYSPVYLQPVKMAMNEWWQKNNALPAYRVSLFGFPSQSINLVWAGELAEIKQTLLNQGWKKPPARDWISTLHRIADVKSTQYLSMISPQYIDQPPELILARQVSEKKPLMVLRLWDANRIIKETNEPLWVGTVGIVPRSYSWLYHSHPGEIEIHANLVFPLAAKKWQWKILKMNLSTGTKHHIKQSVLLIRKQ